MSFLTKDTLYLFCDASILNVQGTQDYIGCPGVIVAEHDNEGNLKPLYSKTKLLSYTTNNNSEITAILLGVYEALKNRNRHSKIKLFSDSMICIFGLRLWILSWIENVNNGILYSSSGQPVANQDIIKHIIQLIAENDLKIELYHQKGHVTSTPRSLEQAKNVFYKSNGISLNDEEIKIISYYNDMIDKLTKNELAIHYSNPLLKVETFNPFVYDIEDCNFEKYKKLIERTM